MNTHDQQYHTLIQHVLDNGVLKSNRTGIDTIGVFGYQMRFDLRDRSIPMITTKKMHTRSIIHELLWYLQGADNIKYLKENGVTIWDEWADESGNLGPVYGYQWRRWPNYSIYQQPSIDIWGNTDVYDVVAKEKPIDQIANLVHKLKNNPNDRRMIVSAWNVADLPEMKLPPCHYTFQCYTKPLTLQQRVFEAAKKYHPDDVLLCENDIDLTHQLDQMKIPKYELSLLLNQRSCDVGLGVPFNIVQYSILLRMFCEVANMVPGEFIWSGADVHIYTNHVEQLKEQLTRIPFDPPKFKFARDIDNIDHFKYEDFVIENYQSHPTIKMDVAI